MKRISFIAALVMTFYSACIAATPEGSLTGSYQLAGKTLVDPPRGEPADTHLRLFLTGTAARDLYHAMVARAEVDECLADGSVTKSMGGTTCTILADGKTFECSLSINIKTQSVESATAC